MTPYYQDDWLTLYGGDNRHVLATLPDESVHCVVTSPPYWGLRDYGTPGQLGLEATPEEYVANLVAVFREVRRVLRRDGVAWLNLGDSYNGSGKGGNGGESSGLKLGRRARDEADYRQGFHNKPIDVSGLKPKDLVGIPWRTAFALQADGWYLRSDIVWSKPNPMPESVTDRPTKAHEYLFLLARSPRYFYDADAVREDFTGHPTGRAGYFGPVDTPKFVADRNDGGRTVGNGQGAGRNLRSVWHIATQPYPGAHFATFPPKLVEPCIKAGCPPDGVVLDPFAGTGTVGLVAQSLSRRAVLIDLNPDYLRQCLTRNQAVPLGLDVA